MDSGNFQYEKTRLFLLFILPPDYPDFAGLIGAVGGVEEGEFL